jgi:hypothetical protein
MRIKFGPAGSSAARFSVNRCTTAKFPADPARSRRERFKGGPFNPDDRGRGANWGVLEQTLIPVRLSELLDDETPGTPTQIFDKE